MENQKKSKGFIVFLIILIIIALGIGFFGEKYIQKEQINCDVGISDKLCWRWHTNITNQVTERLENTTTNYIKDLVK